MKSSLFTKLSQFASSPQGQKMIREATGKAQKFASDPKNRARIEDLRRRFSGGGSTRPR
jgi:hypothetical protein